MPYKQKKHTLGFFEEHLTIGVIVCIILGIVLGRVFPDFSFYISQLQYAQISIPIAICLFFMIYPIMVQIDFARVIEAGKTPKPIALTLLVNWGIKPFTMAFFAWLFMTRIWSAFIPSELASQYIAGMILLGVAPCTAMVLVWSYLSKGNMGHTLVMVAINSLTMLVLYAPLAGFLLGISDIPIPWGTIAFSVGAYVGVPLVAGFFSRRELIKRRGGQWFENVFVKKLHYISITALLFTLIVLFSFQGEIILNSPLIIGMIALPLFIQTMSIFGLTYTLSKFIGLRYEDAAPTAQIGASNHFEVAIAVAIMLFGVESGAALATVVGVLIEVPVMLFLVKICLKTRNWFPVR
ncbi:MAG: arsenical-resistance protein [Candidatus Altiarchaeales archaeon WOR_SM1_86-2]|nr:MAG: arsenical-resistance protein [Candidatus Altiarchaeales archaeon WOR_SM1_86-2]ODS39968.1 MAG: arsenical-resistance protein [Candidatus Altiarchaeales archaeon WOR_SM1_79]